MTIGDLLAVISRRKVVLLTTFVVVMTLTLIKLATSTRLYKGSAVVEVQKGSPDALSLDSMMGTGDAPSDTLDANMTMQTEAQVLQSDSLALNVIEQLNLEHSPDFSSHFNLIGWVLGHLGPNVAVSDPKNAPLAEAPGRREHALKAFAARLKVTPMSGTRLIQVDYLSQDPRTAASVVNLLVQNLRDFNFNTRQDATQQASDWLNNQLEELRKQNDIQQAKVLSLQQGTDVFNVGSADGQGQQVYTPEIDRLQKTTAELSQAQASRMMKQALYQAIKSGDPELISGLAGAGMMAGASPGISGSLTLIQNLRSQEAQTEAQYRSLADKFGPGYPKLGELQAGLEATKQSIADESRRLAARAKNDYEVAQQVEDSDRTLYNKQKLQAEALNSKAVAYQIARQEADQGRTLYEGLVRRMKEADLVARLHSSNITVVDPARVPARPAKPNPILYVAAGVVGGLFLGLCAALLREATDRRVTDLSAIEFAFAGSPIGYLPFHESQKGLRLGRDSANKLSVSSISKDLAHLDIPVIMVAATEPRAAYTESVRALRTSLLTSVHGTPPRVLLVTSSVSGEGKSFLSVNLAITYSQRGKKVLLVDGDLRTPSLQTRLNLPEHTGLSEFLEGDHQAIGAPHPLHIDIGGTVGLDVLTAGAAPAYPAELLGSDAMAGLIDAWRNEYDFIIIDGAPLLPVTDSAQLSHFADFTLVVARHNFTDSRSLERSWGILSSQGVHNAGIVLNGIKAAGSEQFRYYGYRPVSTYGRESHV